MSDILKNTNKRSKAKNKPDSVNSIRIIHQENYLEEHWQRNAQGL